MSNTQQTAPKPEQQNQQQGDQQQGGQQDRSLAEWVSSGIALAILLAVVGLVFFYWFFVPQGPPVLVVSPLGDIRQVGDTFYVPFVISNQGGSTAEDAHVIAKLRVSNQVVEQSELIFTFVSGGEKQRGTVVFHHDPRQGQLQLSIGGYKEP